MTNDRHDPNDDWVLAGAYVDGEADGDERAQVDASPELGEVVEQIRSLRAALGQAPSPPAGARQRAIDAALADGAGQPPSPDAPPATVHALDARRRRMRWVGGAVAAAVIALGVGAVVSGRDRHTSTTSSRSEPAADAGASTEQAAAAAAGEPTPATTEPAPTTTVHLQLPIPAAAGGAVASTAAPAGAASTAATIEGALIDLDEPDQLLILATPAPSASAAGAASDGCVGPGEVVLATITYRGTLAVATFDPAARVRRARAVDGCAVLAEVAATS